MIDYDRKLLQLEESFEALKTPDVSFEFFPPKTEQGDALLWNVVKELEIFSPPFVSVTYGAGGTTREKTYDIVTRIKRDTSLEPAAHLTCVNATKDEIDSIATSYKEANIKRIVALRGDPPNMEGKYVPHPDGYGFAHQLVKGLKKIDDFDISVAAFPEVHPEAVSPDADLDYLKQKIDAGADRAITQYCFDTETVLRFVDNARKAGIEAPIVPGILCIHNFEQTVNFSNRCGASVPEWLIALFEKADDPLALHSAAVYVAAEQCRLFLQEGISEFHFYTLNKSAVAKAVCHLLGLKVSKHA